MKTYEKRKYTDAQIYLLKFSWTDHLDSELFFCANLSSLSGWKFSKIKQFVVTGAFVHQNTWPKKWNMCVHRRPRHIQFHSYFHHFHNFSRKRTQRRVHAGPKLEVCRIVRRTNHLPNLAKKHKTVPKTFLFFTLNECLFFQSWELKCLGGSPRCRLSFIVGSFVLVFISVTSDRRARLMVINMEMNAVLEGMCSAIVRFSTNFLHIWQQFLPLSKGQKEYSFIWIRNLGVLDLDTVTFVCGRNIVLLCTTDEESLSEFSAVCVVQWQSWIARRNAVPGQDLCCCPGNGAVTANVEGKHRRAIFCLVWLHNINLKERWNLKWIPFKHTCGYCGSTEGLWVVPENVLWDQGLVLQHPGALYEVFLVPPCESDCCVGWYTWRQGIGWTN